MYLDKIFSYINSGKQIFDKEIPDNNLIKKKFEYKRNSEELFVILPSWGGHLYLNFFLRKKLFNRNFSFLEYEFPKGILSSNWEFTLNNFNNIRDSVVTEIEKIKKEYKFKKTNVIGVSLGCVNACMVANNNYNIDGLFLIAPGHCLAESMWRGISTQKIKQYYENRKIRLEELKEYWYDLAPENNINNLKSKNISIFISKSDLVIPFYCGKKLLDKINSLEYNLFYKINKSLGHDFTALSFYLNPEKFLFKEFNQ